MSAPLMLSVGTIPFASLVAGLEEAGIRVIRREQGSQVEQSKYICCRGWVSFALSSFPNPVSGERLVSFTANLSRWRWWNFPALWLAGIPLTPWEVWLQRDAAAVLQSLGARRLSDTSVAQGSVPEAEPGAAPDTTR